MTSRLSLTPLELTDSQFILDLANTEGWQKFLGDSEINSEDDAVSYIRNIIANPNTGYWVVRLQSNHASIGVVTFIKRDYLEFPDIGFAFLAGYVNTGYAYEATAALLTQVIHEAQYTHICAIAKASNPPSKKLLNKLGLVFLKEIEVDNMTLQLYEASMDKIMINHLAKSFFSIFSNKESAQPNFELLRQICLPEVLITNKNGMQVDIFDLGSFIETTQHMLTSGALTEFDEQEISEETKIVKNIATRFSEYRKSGIVFRQRFHVTGYKCFQFVRVNQSWKICSVLWSDNETLSQGGN